MFRLPVCIGIAAALVAAPALCAEVHADLARALPDGPGPIVGTAVISDSPRGVLIALDLRGLPPGPHGMHLHLNGSCAPGPLPDGKIVPAGAAGGHWDPGQTGHHMGPDGAGHMGDLPRVEVGPDGSYRGTFVAHRIKDAAALRGHALVIHAGGDTYSDTPPLGGGGARLVCGVLD